MATYRGRTQHSHQVEAWRWFAGVGAGNGVQRASDDSQWVVWTKGGERPIGDGDWVVKDAEGTLQAMRHDAFWRAYEERPPPEPPAEKKAAEPKPVNMKPLSRGKK